MTGILLFIFRITLAISPALLLTLYILRRNPCDNPQSRTIWKCVGFGLLALPFSYLSGEFLFPSYQGYYVAAAIHKAFFHAAIPEELLKLCMLFFITRRVVRIRIIYDGILYAVCVAMGFSGIENLLYAAVYGDWVFTIFGRILFSVPEHFFYAVMMGHFFAKTTLDGDGKCVNFIKALAYPTLAHGTNDSLLTLIHEVPSELAIVNLAMMVMCLLIFFALLIYARRLIITSTFTCERA